MTTANRNETIRVLDTYPNEREANKAMHKAARALRRQRTTHRFGVFVEKRRGSWWLCLAERVSK